MYKHMFFARGLRGLLTIALCAAVCWPADFCAAAEEPSSGIVIPAPSTPPAMPEADPAVPTAPVPSVPAAPSGMSPAPAPLLPDEGQQEVDAALQRLGGEAIPQPQQVPQQPQQAPQEAPSPQPVGSPAQGTPPMPYVPPLAQPDGGVPVPATPDPAAPAFVPQPAPLPGQPALVWQPLLAKLAADGISGPQVQALFAGLAPELSQDPMGRKILELYKNKFVPRTPRPATPPKKVYDNVVTQSNVALCCAFLREHAKTFEQARRRYGVPPQIAVSLLFVETRLGNFLGKAEALYSLASMSLTTKPEDIPLWLAKLPDGYEAHLDWMREVMPQRAEWAYKEVKALVSFAVENNLSANMPGSIYGAIGLCQFMPSNLAPYGADGDGDGRIDLFVPADAIMSLANFLHQHGWRTNLTRIRQHVLLKKYNNSNTYARTIMTLADNVQRARLGSQLKKRRRP